MQQLPERPVQQPEQPVQQLPEPEPVPGQLLLFCRKRTEQRPAGQRRGAIVSLSVPSNKSSVGQSVSGWKGQQMTTPTDCKIVARKKARKRCKSKKARLLSYAHPYAHPRRTPQSAVHCHGSIKSHLALQGKHIDAPQHFLSHTCNSSVHMPEAVQIPLVQCFGQTFRILAGGQAAAIGQGFPVCAVSRVGFLNFAIGVHLLLGKQDLAL